VIASYSINIFSKGKTICGRFFSKTTNQNAKQDEKQTKITESQDDQFVDIGLPPEQQQNSAQLNASTSPNQRSISPSQFSLMSQSSDTSTGSSRNLVSNFFSGIRQRRINNNNNKAQEAQSSFSSTLSSKTNTFLNSISIGLRNKAAPVNDISKANNDKKMDDSVDMDDFKV